MIVFRLFNLEHDIKNMRRQNSVCTAGKHEIMKSSSQFSNLILFYDVAVYKKCDVFELVPTSVWHVLTSSAP